MLRLFFLLSFFALGACTSVPISPHPYKLPFYFTTLDVDRDQHLSYDEWFRGIHQERMWFYARCDYGLDRKIYIQEARECGMSDDAFLYYDRNENAIVEVEEFKDLQPRAFFDFADRDEDGRLDVNEYERVALTQGARQP